MNHHGRILLLYGETIPRDLITQSLARILVVHQNETLGLPQYSAAVAPGQAAGLLAVNRQKFSPQNSARDR